ncbi:hypothetical protein [Eggerthella sinensis]|uniref:hypothetical protein n=1 Tax=Eggerthella sinensis TaxID=242230 RepID=UPI00266D06D1|nr:hypothetical protein [Eggerthella sinensis]
MEHDTAPAAESTEDLTEERVARVVDSLYNHPRHRELLYKTLDFCDEERRFEEAEAFIEAQPERAQALQAPYTLVRCLVDAGGLALVRRDAAGNALDDGGDAGADADAAHLAAEPREAFRTVRTTPAGRAAVELLAPERRIAACVNAVPARRDAFAAVLAFCEQPRTLDAVKQLLANHPALEPSARTAGQRLHAVYFIDRLSEAGGLVWDRAWVTTDAGKRFLASV